MIASEKVEQIERLLREGRLSQREIAQRTGISRGSVNAIALGRRLVESDRCRPSSHAFTPPQGNPARCPSCGGMVQMPCLACYVRSRHGRGQKMPRPCSRHGRGTIATMSFG